MITILIRELIFVLFMSCQIDGPVYDYAKYCTHREIKRAVSLVLIVLSLYLLVFLQDRRVGTGPFLPCLCYISYYSGIYLY